MKKRNPFITNFFRYAFYTVIIIIPLLISSGSHIIAVKIINNNVMGFKQNDYYFLENIFRLTSAMILVIISIVSVFIWSHHKYDIIVNKIERPLRKLIKKKELHKLRFRKTDLFHFFGPLFNEFFSHYLELEEKAEEDKEKLISMIDQCIENPDEDSMLKLKEML